LGVRDGLVEERLVVVIGGQVGTEVVVNAVGDRSECG
jgi:hypothetical protein